MKDRESRIIEMKSASPAQAARPAERRAALLSGPGVWYALAGLSIIFSLYLFLFASMEDEALRHDVAIFIGLWAPMFGILGLRAEVMEMRKEQSQGRK